MNLDLLEYFQRELEFLNSQGPHFAREFPDVGPQLEPPSQENADPHAERLIQAFAWLNARVHLHIDKDLREVTEAFFSVVLPHAQRPFPSCAVAQFAPRIPQQLSADGAIVPRGTTLESNLLHGLACRFRTVYPTTIRPIKLTDVQFHRLDEDSAPAFAPQARSVLRMSVRSLAQELELQLGSSPLRLFLRAPRATAFPLYEILVRDSIGMAVVGKAGRRVELPGVGLLQGAGFQPNESLLPGDARSPDGHRLLLEFFAFPEKHLFVDVCGLDRVDGLQFEDSATVEVYCSRSHRELEKLVSTKTIRLNCTPITNLYSMRTEPIPLTHEQTDYHIVPDARFSGRCEVFSIDRVSAVSADRGVRIPGMYEPGSPGSARDCDASWITQRRPGGEPHNVPEIWIGLADPHGQFLALDTWTLDIEATCMNADMPASLPFDGDGPQLSMPGELMMDVECVVPPTRRRAPPISEWGHGKLVALLALQSLPMFCDDSGESSRLGDVIGLWNSDESREGRAFLDCLTNADAHQVFEEIWIGTDRCFARGVEVTLQLDESRSPGGSVFLFASLLERFLAMSSATNSFTRVVAQSSETNHTVYRFPARAGHQILASLT